MENGFVETIESVHDAIANDEAIQKQIEKIKVHECANVVGGCE